MIHNVKSIIEKQCPVRTLDDFHNKAYDCCDVKVRTIESS